MNSKLLTILLLILSIQLLSAQQPNIQPTPQSAVYGHDKIEKPKTVRIIGEGKADKASVQLLKALFNEVSTNKKNFPIYIGQKSDDAMKQFAFQIPDHAEGYYLSIEYDKIVVAGNDARGTYYGVQTLKQLLDADKLPLVEIKDYPDISARGVVEGFYGNPWTFEDRESQLKFYGDNKLNTYIYGPKDDPYHSSPNWRKLYPADEAKAIEKLVAIANQNHVDFVWAIHPGLDIKWTTEDRDALVNKFESMYGLGVRAFAVFFDDISGEGVNADKQAELLNFVDNQFVKSKHDVLPLILCPTEYNKSWSNIEGGYLTTLGQKLNPSIHIMWTGDRVISDIDRQGLEWINQHINRKAYIWWNFPVSDYVRDHLLMGPAYGLDTTASNLMSGFMTNPMEFAEASKVAIYSAADYAWNIEKYDFMQSWERSLKSLMPNHYNALRTFAIHNADLGPNGHGYRRDESWEFKETAAQYLQDVRNGVIDTDVRSKVEEEFMKMIVSSSELARSKDNPALIKEISPWLQQFRLLASSGVAAMSLQEALSVDNKNGFERLYEYIKVLKEKMYNNSNTLNQNPYQPGVKTGTLVLEPLIDSLLVEFVNQYETKYNEQLPSLANYNPHLLYTNVEQVKNLPIRYLRKTASISPMLEVLKIPAKGYVGLELVPEQIILQTVINLGLDEFPAWAIVQVSTDGENWITYEGKTNKQSHWIGGKLSGAYRFVRLYNRSDRTQESYLKRFEVKVE